MQLSPYEPRLALRPFNRSVHPFDGLFNRFNHVLEDRLNEPFHPSVDIYEKDGLLVIEAELPGIDKDAINVDIDGRLLTISGERKSTLEEDENSRYRRERSYGSFKRSFKLPFAIDDQQVDAVYRDGVLTLSVGKPEQLKPRQIAIN